MTFGPSRPRPGGSSDQHGTPSPSPTPPPPTSWRSAPRPKHDAPRPATSQSPHPGPTAPQHETAAGIQGRRASPAGSRAIPSPRNTGAVGTQPEHPPGNAHSHREPAPSPTSTPQPLTPPVSSAHSARPAANQAAATQAHPEPRPHHGTPDRPAAGSAYAPPNGPPAQAHTATPTDTTAAQPSDTVHPHTPGPNEDLIPQAPATSGAEDLPATTHVGPAPQRHQGPTNRADGAAGRAVIFRSPSTRPGPRPGPGTHRCPGGRATARWP